MLRRLSAAFAAAVCLLLPQGAGASIAAPPPPHTLYAESDAVFVGKVRSIGDTTMKVSVTECLSGRVAGVVEVFPVYEPVDVLPPDPDRKPAFTVGERVLVAADLEDGGYRFRDHTLWSTHLDGRWPAKGSVKLAKEMLRVAALQTETERAAALVALLRANDRLMVDAAVQYQYAGLDTVEESAPHTKELVRALDAPLLMGRKGAMRALQGLTPPEALPRLFELARSEDVDEATHACHVLAHYDRKDAVDAIVRAARRPGKRRTQILSTLGMSPLPRAHELLLKTLRTGTGAERGAAVSALEQRVAKYGATKRDRFELVAALRRGVEGSTSYRFADALLAVRSPELSQAMLAIVRDDHTSYAQRATAYIVLNRSAKEFEVPGGVELLRANEALFVRRLDEGGTALHLFWVLRQIGTDNVRKCLERAQESHPDKHSRWQAGSTLADLDRE